MADVREVIARAAIRGSAGEDAERHAFKFDTAKKTDALRSADAIIAALTEAGVLPQWRTIESAPKDGERIILAKFGWVKFTDDLEQGSEAWKARIFDDMAPRVYRRLWICGGRWSGTYQNWNDGIEPCGLAGPTHWMPEGILPPPVCTVPPAGWWVLHSCSGV